MTDRVKHILIPLNGATDIEAVLETGLSLAAPHRAHLSVIVIGDDPKEVTAMTGEGLSSAIIQEMMEAVEHESHRRLLQIRLHFNNFVRTREIETLQAGHQPAQKRSKGATASFEMLTGAEYETITWRARLSDYALVPHLGSADDARASEILHAILFDTGCPLIVAPPSAPSSVGKRISIAWNGTAESASALRGVIPFAQRAEQVQILSSVDYHRRGPDAEMVQRHLALHGITATISEFSAVERDIGAGILAAVGAFKSDLLAMGAYSHSRLRQMILGGVTRHVLEAANVAVLMSH